MVAPRRHRRRPVWWLLAGVLGTAAALLVDAAVSTHASQRENALAYLDQVRPEIQRSTDEGADLADVRAKAVTLGRDGITRRLDRLAADARTTLAVVSGLTPPLPLRVAHAYLVAALGVRSRAADEAKAAMAAALAEGPPDPAVTGLASAGQDIELGDRAFALFAGSLPKDVATPPVTSTWVADGSIWTPNELSTFVATLRSSTSLTPVHDLAVVTFVTDPPPVGSDNGAAIIAPTKGFQVSIVVANVGNLAEHHATVTATLHTNGANTNETVRDFVDLAPGQQTALEIGSLHPLPGTTGTLTVAIAPVAGETDLANNTQQLAVELH